MKRFYFFIASWPLRWKVTNEFNHFNIKNINKYLFTYLVFNILEFSRVVKSFQVVVFWGYVCVHDEYSFLSNSGPFAH